MQRLVLLAALLLVAPAFAPVAGATRTVEWAYEILGRLCIKDGEVHPTACRDPCTIPVRPPTCEKP